MPRNYVAGGTIYPCRIVSIMHAGSPDSANNTSSDFKVIEDIVVAQECLGISCESTDWPPITDSHITNNGYAAIAGEHVKIYGVGEECLLELAGTVNPGDQIMTNGTTNGKGLAVVTNASTTSTPQYVVGIAQQYGVATDKIRVLVQPGVFTAH